MRKAATKPEPARRRNAKPDALESNHRAPFAPCRPRAARRGRGSAVLRRRESDKTPTSLGASVIQPQPLGRSSGLRPQPSHLSESAPLARCGRYNLRKRPATDSHWRPALGTPDLGDGWPAHSPFFASGDHGGISTRSRRRRKEGRPRRRRTDPNVNLRRHCLAHHACVRSPRHRI